MAKIQKEKIEKINNKAIIIKLESMKKIKDILLSYKKEPLLNFNIKNSNIKNINYYDYYLNPNKIRMNKNIHICQISKGCISKCAYCIVKEAKGNLYSFSPNKIVENIKLGLTNGCTEIWITSQDNSQYGLDFKEGTRYYGIRLPQLLKMILDINGNFKVRIGMMNPVYIYEIMEEMMQIYMNDKIYKVLHIPIQSASNIVLKNMNRKYKIEIANKIINNFRNLIPNIMIITDLIVGFCYETEEDFQKSIDWV